MMIEESIIIKGEMKMMMITRKMWKWQWLQSKIEKNKHKNEKDFEDMETVDDENKKNDENSNSDDKVSVRWVIFMLQYHQNRKDHNNQYDIDVKKTRKV